MADKRLNILEGIEKGISQSYLGNFNKIVNLDIDGVPGVAFPNLRLREFVPWLGYEYTYASKTFTAATSDVCTLTSGSVASYWQEGQSVVLTTTGTLPAGLSTNTVYYAFGFSGGTFKLASSVANLRAETAVDITDTGTGTHTVKAIEMKNIRNFVAYGSTYFAVVRNGGVWMYDTGTAATWIQISAYTDVFVNIALFKDYLIAFDNSDKADAFGALSNLDTAAWTASFIDFDGTSGFRPNVLMDNGILYIGDYTSAKGLVASLEENTGETFAPGTGATFTFNSAALDLPKNSVPCVMEKYNNRLVIGTGISGYQDSKLYFWDTFSPSYDSVLKTGNDWTWILKEFNGVLYFMSAASSGVTNGIVYATNGYSIKKAFEIPRATLNVQQLNHYGSIYVMWNSIMAWKDKLYLGISGQNSAGIYCLDVNQGSIHTPYLLPSLKEGVPGQEADAETIYYYAMLPIDDTEFMVSTMESLNTGDFYKISRQNIGSYRLYTESYLITGLMTVGSKYQPKTFRFFEIELGKEMSTGETITLSYRNNLTDSFTTIGSMSYTADGAIASKIIENSAVNGDQIQFKVQVSIANANTSVSGKLPGTAPELKAIYLY